MLQCVRCGLLYTFAPPGSCVLCGGEVWITVRFSPPSGGASVLALWPRSSAISFAGSRSNREVTPVKAQKGGECRGV